MFEIIKFVLLFTFIGDKKDLNVKKKKILCCGNH